MPTIDEINCRQRCEFLKWAVIEHSRTWEGLDGKVRQSLAADDVIDAKLVREIGKEYLVNRVVRRGEDGSDDRHANWLADRLNQTAQSWPDDLEGRALKCARLARLAAKEGHTNGEPASAVTKFMWFLRPDGWTLFDNLAATGLGIPNRQATCRMLLFFEVLADRSFVRQSFEVNKALRRGSFEHLYGERVIDKFLMLSGADDDWTGQIIGKCEEYHDALPKRIGSQLGQLAQQIGQGFGETMLRDQTAV